MSPNFVQAVFEYWTGRKPSSEQANMLDACLAAVIDHGPETLSAKAARVVASGGTETHAAVAAGLLACGKHHGAMALQAATMMLREAVESKTSAKALVKQALKDGRRLPGFGHRVYTTDPRAEKLMSLASELGLADKHTKLAREIETELEKQKGKKLCLNVDGAIAALLPALGIMPDIAPGIFLVARAAGLTKHVAHEQKEKPASQRKK